MQMMMSGRKNNRRGDDLHDEQPPRDQTEEVVDKCGDNNANNNNDNDGGGTEKDANLQVIIHNVAKFVSTLGGGINQQLGEHGTKILEEVREKHEALVIQPIEIEISRLDNLHTAAVEIKQSLQRAVEKADEYPALNINMQQLRGQVGVIEQQIKELARDLEMARQEYQSAKDDIQSKMAQYKTTIDENLTVSFGEGGEIELNETSGNESGVDAEMMAFILGHTEPIAKEFAQHLKRLVDDNIMAEEINNAFDVECTTILKPLHDKIDELSACVTIAQNTISAYKCVEEGTSREFRGAFEAMMRQQNENLEMWLEKERMAETEYNLAWKETMDRMERYENVLREKLTIRIGSKTVCTPGPIPNKAKKWHDDGEDEDEEQPIVNE